MKVYILIYSPWGEKSVIQGVYPSVSSVKKQITYLTGEDGPGYDESDLSFSAYVMEKELEDKTW